MRYIKKKWNSINICWKRKWNLPKPFYTLWMLIILHTVVFLFIAYLKCKLTFNSSTLLRRSLNHKNRTFSQLWRTSSSTTKRLKRYCWNGKDRCKSRGLNETLTISSFRFNQPYDELRTVRFLEDLFNNPNVRYLVSAVQFSCNSVTLP
jgi:hypothetical protein